ncbi:hypothetical protein CB1_000318012 [Camelus ferus]|nr:hypothetical protein CB1_000318012 [Camelus ferus]
MAFNSSNNEEKGILEDVDRREKSHYPHSINTVQKDPRPEPFYQNTDKMLGVKRPLCDCEKPEGALRSFLQQVYVAVAPLELHSLTEGVQLVVHSLFSQETKKFKVAGEDHN